MTDLHTDDTTFLRGMWPTDSNGMMEMHTIFPGFYVERAIHIHVRVYNNWVLRENGTLSSGDIVSAGQLYFDEELEEKIMALDPYVTHTEINRTTNAVDSIFADSFAGGYDPVVSVVAADGEDVTKGMSKFALETMSFFFVSRCKLLTKSQSDTSPLVSILLQLRLTAWAG